MIEPLLKTQLEPVARRYAMQQHVIEHIVFAKPLLAQCQCETRRIYRKVKFFENVGESTDVVFVAVSKDDRGQIVAIFFEKIEIRDGNVHAERRFFRKAHSGIDDYHFVLIPDAHAVHPKFADPAKRYDLNFAHNHDL